MAKKIDIIGWRVGKIVVISQSEEKGSHGQAIYNCKCDCGNMIKRVAQGIIRGYTTSCPDCRVYHKSLLTHGYSGTPTHRAWKRIKNRCYNKNDQDYPSYGGRGVVVDERWMGPNGFEHFLEDMGEMPIHKKSIDRYPDKTGNYVIGNCRWADDFEQANNRTNNHIVEYKNDKYTLMQLSKKINIGYDYLKNRLKKGDSIEKIIKRNEGNFISHTFGFIG